MILLIAFTIYFLLIFSQRNKIRRYYLPHDKAKLKFLLYLRKHFPEIFRGVPRYGMDLFEVLDIQVKIYKRLQGMREFRDLLRERQDLLTFIFQNKRNSSMNEGEGSGRRNNCLLEDLCAFLHEEAGEGEIGPADKIQSLSRALLFSPERITRTFAFYYQLPPKEKTVFFKKTSEEKRKFMMEIFSREGNGPAFLEFCSLAGQMPEKVFFRLMEEGEGLYLRLRKYVQIYVLTQIQGERRVEEIIEKLQKIKESGFYLDKLLYKERVSSLKNLLSPHFNPYQETRREILQWISPQSKEGGQGRVIRLDEVPPFIGIFRGHVGKDCSTLYSFPYPNSPLEKVFYIYNDPRRGEIKGYLSGTIVEVEGKRTFYIHTIAGDKISRNETKMMVAGLYFQREILGVRQILIPVRRQTVFLMNSRNIRNQMEEFTKGVPKSEVTYLDLGIRKKIDTAVIAQYDRATSNTYGHIYHPPKGEFKYLTCQNRIKDYPAFNIKERIQKSDVIRLILDLKHMERKDTVRRVLKVGKIRLEDFKKLTREMNNHKRVGVEEYLVRIRQSFQKFQIEFNEEFLQNKSVYFSRGFLRAADAMDTDHREASIDHLIRLLKKKGVTGGTEISQFIVKHKDVLNKNPKFLKFARGLLDEKSDGTNRDCWKFLFLFNLQIFSQDNLVPMIDRLLKEDVLRAVRQDFCEGQKIGIKGQIIFKIFEEFNPLPLEYYLKIEETLKFILERSDPLSLNQMVKMMLPALRNPQANLLMERILDKRHRNWVGTV